MKDLPLNGRSYDLLLPLNPGVVEFHFAENRRHGSFQFDQRKQFRRVRESASAKSIFAERRRISRALPKTT